MSILPPSLPFKNQLQEWLVKNGGYAPKYITTQNGSCNNSSWKSTVQLVFKRPNQELTEKSFTSDSFPKKVDAENHAAKIAMDDVGNRKLVSVLKPFQRISIYLDLENLANVAEELDQFRLENIEIMAYLSITHSLTHKKYNQITICKVPSSQKDAVDTQIIIDVAKYLTDPMHGLNPILIISRDHFATTLQELLPNENVHVMTSTEQIVKYCKNL